MTIKQTMKRVTQARVKASNIVIESKYKREVKQALKLLTRVAEESGQYGEAKEAELKAVELLETFIKNRI